MPVNKNTIYIRQRMIDRILAEKGLLQNLSHHYGADVETVKAWVTDLYSDEMIRNLITGLDRLEKAKEELEKKQRIYPTGGHAKKES